MFCYCLLMHALISSFILHPVISFLLYFLFSGMKMSFIYVLESKLSVCARARVSASRRYQAAEWLRQMDHGASATLPKEASEEEFCLALRNGLILCNVLNKVNPGAVLKVQLLCFKSMFHGKQHNATQFSAYNTSQSWTNPYEFKMFHFLAQNKKHGCFISFSLSSCLSIYFIPVSIYIPRWISVCCMTRESAWHFPYARNSYLSLIRAPTIFIKFFSVLILNYTLGSILNLKVSSDFEMGFFTSLKFI